MNFTLLGGGIASLSLAHFLKNNTTILEKEPRMGGLCQSYNMNGIAYDIGPHIIFSKNQEVLDLHTTLIETNKIRRSNQIYHEGRLVKYPFENDLYALPTQTKDYCLQEFLNNPYEGYHSQNMLQFFLKTFGEGITRTYLQPYNEKIWKFDPSCMDTQMVERIPKPPKEDVIKSAEGIPTEGYTHQLYFHYPKRGGFQTLIDKYIDLIQGKSDLRHSVEIQKIFKSDGKWVVATNCGEFVSDKLVNCMPIHELFKYIEAPAEVRSTLKELKYNSIHIAMLQLKKDKIGDHFALYFADKDTIFHRLSKLNFLGEEYCLPNGGSTLMAEITFRPGSYLASLSQEEVQHKVAQDLEKLNLIERSDIISQEIRTSKYAYVIYDLQHRSNTDFVLNYLQEQGIYSCGRFAEFEYMNSDKVVEQSQKLAARLNTLNG